MNSKIYSIKKGYADCTAGQIHYRKCGADGRPVICFFHQTASSGVMFEKVMRNLAPDFLCYSFDSPGFGQSFQPENIPSISYLAECLLEAIGNLGIENFHACGHHTGGCVAIEIPTLKQSGILSLTIIGPVLVNDEERQEYMKTFIRPFTIEPTGNFLPGTWEYLRSIGAGATIELHNREMADHLIAHKTMPMAFSAAWGQNFEALYKKVDCPLLIMCSRDDVLWPLFERAGSLRPDAKQAIVDGGDFQPDNDPEGVSRAIREFLQQQN